MVDGNWDLRSNIKGKPGSQGTLFQPASKDVLNPQQRWPRGYTPERQREVSQALDLHTTIRPTMMVDPPRRATEVRARVQDTIARSTVPADHLKGLREIHDQPAQFQRATYWPHTRTMAVNMFEPDGGQNLIHELGHHRDAATGETKTHLSDESKRKDIVYAPSGRGPAEAAEGVADNYYVEHYRGPGRNGGRVSTGRYEDVGTADRMQGYRAVRPAPPLQTSQFAPQEHIPEMDVKKQAARQDAVRQALR